MPARRIKLPHANIFRLKFEDFKRSKLKLTQNWGPVERNKVFEPNLLYILGSWVGSNVVRDMPQFL